MTTGKKKKAQDQASQPRTAVPGLGVSRRDAFSFLVLGVLIAVVYFPAALAGNLPLRKKDEEKLPRRRQCRDFSRLSSFSISFLYDSTGWIPCILNPPR